MGKTTGKIRGGTVNQARNNRPRTWRGAFLKPSALGFGSYGDERHGAS